MTDFSADYVVVGGGLTGCLVASRLSQSPQKPRVVLLEAGSDPSSNPAASGLLSGLSLLGGQFDYADQSEPVATTANRVHVLNSGKALGGGSILNFGGWLHADAPDYDEWAAIAEDSRWSYEGIKPWLRRVERFERSDARANTDQNGFEGPMNVTSISAAESGARQYPLREPVKKAWMELGVPLNLERKNGSITGVTEFCENSRDGMRQPSQMAFPLDNVQVLTKTTGRRVIFDGTTAIGVELADGRKITTRKEVIVCAGAYRTPQFLMLSGIGPSSVLAENDIPMVYEAAEVGQNLHDHFAIYLAFRLRDPSLGYALGSAGWKNPALFKGLPFDWVVNGSLPAEIMSKYETDPEKQKRNLWEIITAYVPPGIPGIPMDGTHIATSTMLLLPTSRGTVSIRSNNSNDSPLVQPNYFSTPLERDTLIHATRMTLRLMMETQTMSSIVACETPPSGEGLEGLEPLTLESSDAEIEERIRRTGMQHFHSGGTAAMGRVVDSEGRVIGVERLRVMDASVVPIPLGGHPQATLYAMAEQLVNLIATDA
ncbi:choline dehydrogenase [Xylariaceae sp. FL1272]|nr:choline dehydrogenase [Xylariaceae sp. FL1272]